MGNNDLPEPLREAARRAAEAVANSPSMRALREQIAETARVPNQQCVDAFARQQAAMSLRWSQRATEAMAPALEARRTAINEALERFGLTARQRLAESLQRSISFDATALQGILENLDALHHLNQDARAAAAIALEQSYATAEAGTADEVSEELITSFEETARDFAATDGSSLPPKTQRTLFIWFCGILVFLALMQAVLSSEAAKELLEDASLITPVAGGAMLAAGKAWDRVMGRLEDDEDTTPE